METKKKRAECTFVYLGWSSFDRRWIGGKNYLALSVALSFSSLLNLYLYLGVFHVEEIVFSIRNELSFFDDIIEYVCDLVGSLVRVSLA